MLWVLSDSSVDIDSTLAVKYHGVKYTDHVGYFISKITTDFWDTLNSTLEKISYKTFDTAYEHSVDDLSTEIYIYYNNKVKHVRGQSESLPGSVMAVYQWLMAEIKRFKLQAAKDSLAFPGMIEKPLPMQTIEFTPPDFDNR